MRAATGVCFLALAACSSGAAPTPSPDPVEKRIDALRAEISEVASTQASIDSRLNASLDAIRQIDELVGELRRPETIDDAKNRWPPADAAFLAVELQKLRDEPARLAVAVDGARATLRTAQALLVTDRETRYLKAEDAVLRHVRTYAAAGDALVQVLQAHWPMYQDVHALTAKFVETRWFYRTAAEAADAYELAVRDRLAELAAAQAEISAYRDARNEAGIELNNAHEEAASVWSEAG